MNLFIYDCINLDPSPSLFLAYLENPSRRERRRLADAVNPMSKRYVPPLPPPSQQSSPLFKQRSWSPDAERDEAWLRRKEVYGSGLRRSQSFTEDDLDELKGCLDLGFGFEPDSPELDPKLSHALPALPFYCAVNRQYNGRISRSSSASSMDSFSDAGSTNSIIDQGDDPEMVKIKLRQWAQVVACSVRQFPRGPK